MISGPNFGRRDVMLAGLSAGLTGAITANPAQAENTSGANAASTYGMVPGGGAVVQTASLQQALDAAAASGVPLALPTGLYKTGSLTLKSGTQVLGVPGRTVLQSTGKTILAASGGDNIRLSGIVFEGGGLAPGEDEALFAATDCTHLNVADCRFLNSREGGVSLRKVSGAVRNCEFANIAKAALFSEDAAGLEITQNHVHDCGDNGILIWRSKEGEDGTLLSGNRIERIAAKSGGSGQNGNGINVFRAGSVLITQNRITDCAYSAIRSNAGSNCQMIANSCARAGEVALYAEFGFQGAVIANNIVDTAAMGVSVTNFNEGGRLAVVQGNLVRNLFLRKTGESRGIGIGVEADSTVTGNVIEGAPAYGILVGWGEYVRDVSVTANVIRNSHIGIGVSSAARTGVALITDNLIDGAKDGAIRSMKGPTPVGPDLAGTGATQDRNLKIYANIGR